MVDLEMNFNLLKNRSKCCMVGCPDIKHDLKLNLMQLLMNQQELTSTLVGSRLEIESMLDFMRFNEISPQVEVYKFEDMQKAINSLAYGDPRPPRYRNVVETASFFKTFKPKLSNF
jgi:D-arabinose 1-dehydrogenase-like Zn-dependent alcohol dehydrogenase